MIPCGTLRDAMLALLVNTKLVDNVKRHSFAIREYLEAYFGREKVVTAIAVYLKLTNKTI